MPPALAIATLLSQSLRARTHSSLAASSFCRSPSAAQLLDPLPHLRRNGGVRSRAQRVRSRLQRAVSLKQLSLAARRLSQHLVRGDAGVHTPKRVAQRKDDAGRDQARGRRARLARLLLRVEEGLHVRVQSKVLRSKNS